MGFQYPFHCLPARPFDLGLASGDVILNLTTRGFFQTFQHDQRTRYRAERGKALTMLLQLIIPTVKGGDCFLTHAAIVDSTISA